MHMLEKADADITFASKQVFDWPTSPVIKFFKKRWVYHVFFWLLYYGIFSVVVVFGIYEIRDLTFYYGLIPIYVLDILLVYFNFYVLIPKLLVPRRYFYYGLTLSLAICLMGLVNIFLKQLYAHYGSTLFAVTAGFNFRNTTTAISERFYAVVLTGIIKIAKDWIQNQQRLKEREKQLLEAELNFLKSQIQPHFFFNTLNNLYSLTLKKSDDAPEVVLKLSALMSYMLYETNAPKVSLNKEITCLENYIDLERLRFGNNLTFHLIRQETRMELMCPR